MQLLHTHPDRHGEAPVIHIVYREASRQAHTLAQWAPYDSVSYADDEVMGRFGPALANPSHTSLDIRESITSRSGETFSPVPSDQTGDTLVVPGLAPADPALPQSSLRTSHSHADSIPSRNNTQVPSTAEFLYPQEVIVPPEDFPRDSRTSSVHDTLLRPNAAYPEYIHDTQAYVSDLPPSRKNYCPLWTYVLEYWFPPTEGFQIVEDWDPEKSFRAQQLIPRWSRQDFADAFPTRPKPSLAVLDTMSPTEPFLLVNIHNGMSVNDFSRICAKTTLEETFETLRSCSFCAGFETLCVVSAVGARWNMVVRETGWLEAEADGCTDYVGQLKEDVTTSESYRVMGYCFEELKRSVLRRREERWNFLPTFEYVSNAAQVPVK